MNRSAGAASLGAVKSLLLLCVVAACTVSSLAATRVEDLIRSDFAVKDAATARRAAEEFCRRAGPIWTTGSGPLHARLLALTRAPRRLVGNKVNPGEVVWIMLVDNPAESDLVPTPHALLCVTAREGMVVALVPEGDKR